MKKNLLLVTLVFFVSASIFSCQVILENDSNALVSITDLVDQSPAILIKAGEKVNANKNPKIHADLRIIVNPHTNSQQYYRIKQTSCSKTHEIPITISSLFTGRWDKSLLNIQQEHRK